ncbi:MAG: DoxX family protein [Alphaproteobacteria bacterium]|nr:DoxX family protein [Alphaproteobacteria bacterium]
MLSFERMTLVLFRLLMAWTFLYAASHQVFNPNFSIVGFLSHTKTFHDFFVPFTDPAIAPILTFLVAYGHLAIGLSLLTGFMVRASSLAGAAILMMYWMAHMDFPYIENANNFIVDYHFVYAVLLIWLGVQRAGHVWGLDGFVSQWASIQHNLPLRWATSAS